MRLMYTMFTAMSLLVAGEAHAQKYDFSDLDAAFGKSKPSGPPAKWERRCTPEIQKRQACRSDSKLGCETGEVYPKFAGEEPFKFGTIYYLVANIDTLRGAERARFACYLTNAGDVWDLQRLQ